MATIDSSDFQSVGVYAISAANMALHFELLAESQGGCPIPVLFGDPETGNNYNVTARNVTMHWKKLHVPKIYTGAPVTPCFEPNLSN